MKINDFSHKSWPVPFKRSTCPKFWLVIAAIDDFIITKITLLGTSFRLFPYIYNHSFKVAGNNLHISFATTGTTVGFTTITITTTTTR